MNNNFVNIYQLPYDLISFGIYEQDISNLTWVNNYDDNKTFKGITFNYLENFNRVVELSTENYSSWKTNILCHNNM